MGGDGENGTGETFNVLINSAGDSSGLLGVHAAAATANGQPGLLIKGIKEGLIAQWNEGHRDQEIRIGDVIIEVNGVRGLAKDLHKAILQNMDLKIVLKLTILRNAHVEKAGQGDRAAANAEKTAEHAVGAMVLTFRLPEGTIKTIAFQKRPLGLDFSK